MRLGQAVDIVRTVGNKLIGSRELEGREKALTLSSRAAFAIKVFAHIVWSRSYQGLLFPAFFSDFSKTSSP